MSFIPVKVGVKFVDVLENALFLQAFGYMFELTVKGLCVIATYRGGSRIFSRGVLGDNNYIIYKNYLYIAIIHIIILIN